MKAPYVCLHQRGRPPARRATRFRSLTCVSSSPTPGVGDPDQPAHDRAPALPPCRVRPHRRRWSTARRAVGCRSTGFHLIMWHPLGACEGRRQLASFLHAIAETSPGRTCPALTLTVRQLLRSFLLFSAHANGAAQSPRTGFLSRPLERLICSLNCRDEVRGPAQGGAGAPVAYLGAYWRWCGSVGKGRGV